MKPYCGKPLEPWHHKLKEVDKLDEQPTLTLEDRISETPDSEELESDHVAVPVKTSSTMDRNRPQAVDNTKSNQRGDKITTPASDKQNHQRKNSSSEGRITKQSTVDIVESQQKTRYPQRQDKRKPQRYL